MGNQKEALMKNLEDIDKEEVAVIHSAFGDKPHVVAFVRLTKLYLMRIIVNKRSS